MKRTNLYIRESQAESLQRISSQEGRPAADLVREAIDTWLGMRDPERVQTEDWRQNLLQLMNQRRRKIKTDVKLGSGDIDKAIVKEVRAVRRQRRQVK